MADRRRTREQWQSIVEGWPKSGLTQAAYCAQQGISVTSFHRWREQLREAANPGDHETRQGEGERFAGCLSSCTRFPSQWRGRR
ncbi:hypothetical protein ThidrDRAFT_4639 [Thiorhodococcus drewsii AZ1]|uniref:Transposase n=1 Tax=Thiorhodococcus drewsii AZ1 TaxID=765913 RepID=G2E8M5_9GAMM|nr:hypothetical protein ThidrDRAFT_4639 [Thiorhodococcus drewsii AZ1]